MPRFFSKVGKEINRMFLYVTVPVLTVWVFNKDFFRDKINFPILKAFMTKEEYEELQRQAGIDKDDE